MVQAPAICDDCGMTFASGFEFGGTGSVVMTGNKSGPCPACDGMGSVPDGTYHFHNETLRIVSTWSPSRRDALAQALTAAQQTGDREAVENTLKDAPDLWDALAQLLIRPTLVSSGRSWRPSSLP